MYSYNRFLLVLVFLFIGIAELPAAVLLVPSETYPTIQSAIDATSPGDSVQVAPGYYPENIVFPGYDITLTAYDPNCYVDTIISAEGSGAVITFNGDESNDCILRGFTITGGMEGGIRAVNSSPTIQSCHVVNNYDTSSLAAGIFLSGNASPVMYNCSIVSNYPSGGSIIGMGGIYCYDGVNLTLINCSLVDNGAPYNPSNYAQIYCHTSHISAINCIISENTFEQGHTEVIGGAGILCVYTSFNPTPQPQIIDCEISHNRSNLYGGGIFVDSLSNITLNSCLIHHNYAAYGGGGIAAPKGMI